MIKPAQAPLTAYRYRSFDATVIIKENGVVKDLTGHTVLAHIRIRKEGPLIIALTVDVTAIDGKIVLTLTDVDLADISAGAYFYDIEITEISSGLAYNYLEGTFNVLGTVTR